MPERPGLLFVCTGNICRSPMAEGLARRSLERLHPSLLPHLSLGSAGVSGLDGEPATAEAVITMRDRGIDISSHRARSTTSAVLSGCGLALVMEERQRRRLAHTARGVPVFLLLKFAEACRAAGAETGTGAAAGGEEGAALVGARLSRLVEAAERMERGSLWDASDYSYEVSDPIGMRLDEYRRLAELMSGPVEDIIGALGAHPVGAPGAGQGPGNAAPKRENGGEMD